MSSRPRSSSRRGKLNFWRPSCCLGSGEVRVVTLESSPARKDIVRKESDVRVVVLDGVVVSLALDSDPVFRARQFVLQTEKVFVRFQLRIVFDDDEQPSKRAIQLIVRGDLVRRSLGTQQSGASTGNVMKNGLLLRRK